MNPRPRTFANAILIAGFLAFGAFCFLPACSGPAATNPTAASPGGPGTGNSPSFKVTPAAAQLAAQIAVQGSLLAVEPGAQRNRIAADAYTISGALRSLSAGQALSVDQLTQGLRQFGGQNLSPSYESLATLVGGVYATIYPSLSQSANATATLNYLNAIATGVEAGAAPYLPPTQASAGSAHFVLAQFCIPTADHHHSHRPPPHTPLRLVILVFAGDYAVGTPSVGLLYVQGAPSDAAAIAFAEARAGRTAVISSAHPANSDDLTPDWQIVVVEYTTNQA